MCPLVERSRMINPNFGSFDASTAPGFSTASAVSTATHHVSQGGDEHYSLNRTKLFAYNKY